MDIISEHPSISSDTLKSFEARVARVIAVTGNEVRGDAVLFRGRLKTSLEGALAEQVAQHEQRPFLADHIKRPRNRAILSITVCHRR
jgi:hypothetical protein